MRNRFYEQGFTLIELLVVITIIAILASISVPVYNSVTERAKITKVLSKCMARNRSTILRCRNCEQIIGTLCVVVVFVSHGRARGYGSHGVRVSTIHRPPIVQ